MERIDKIHAWKQTKIGQLVTGSIELLIGYFFASKAIDTGSWWFYLFGFIFIIGGIQNLARLVISHGKH